MNRNKNKHVDTRPRLRISVDNPCTSGGLRSVEYDSVTPRRTQTATGIGDNKSLGVPPRRATGRSESGCQ